MTIQRDVGGGEGGVGGDLEICFADSNYLRYFLILQRLRMSGRFPCEHFSFNENVDLPPAISCFIVQEIFGTFFEH